MAAPSAEPSTQPAPGPAGASSELTFRGRAVSAQDVASAYFIGSVLVLALGVALNYVLTGGRWYIGPSESNLRSYVREDPYDLVTASLLGLSLLGLGTGFLASRAARLASPIWSALAIGAVVFLAAAALRFQGLLSFGDATLWLVMGSVLLFLTVAWALAALVGPGPRMHYVRGAGFVLFGFYWATQAMRLYHAEEGDFVNAIFAAAAVFFFNYFAYHELLSIQRREDPRALQWLAGTAFLTTGVYFVTHKLEPVSHWLILVVAKQTTWLLQFFGQGVLRSGGSPDGSQIYYPAPASEGGAWFPIQIILACTAIQSIMIFVGGILALRPPRRGEGFSGKAQLFEALRPSYQTRRLFALLLTVPLIYVLNLFRNTVIIWMSAQETPVGFREGSWATRAVCTVSAGGGCGASDAAFWFSHNIIGKGGSLVALIIIAFMVFQILPEIYDSIIGLLDLRDRRGPLERWLRPRPGGGNGRGRTAEPAPSAARAGARPAPAPDELASRP